MHTKIWINQLTKAFEYDLTKQAPKCFNKWCIQLRPKEAMNCGWKKRSIQGRKEWLCSMCSQAYDAKQFCEFCFQIYLKNSFENSALDGKEWAQCEGQAFCKRWAHVDCISKYYGKTREEVVADEFKYFCNGCRVTGRKRINSDVYVYKREVSMKENSIRCKRKCTE